MPWQILSEVLAARDAEHLSIWAEKKVRFNCDHVIPANPKTYRSSAEAGVHCGIFREALGKTVWAASYFPLPIRIEVCFAARRCDCDMNFLPGPWDKCTVLQTLTALCLWFDTDYRFLSYFLLLGQFFNYGIVLCFIFLLLSFLIILLKGTVLRAGLILMLLSPSFSCRRTLKDWKGVKILHGKPCWFIPVILWSSEWENPKLTGHFGLHILK